MISNDKPMAAAVEPIAISNKVIANILISLINKVANTKKIFTPIVVIS